MNNNIDKQTLQQGVAMIKKFQGKLKAKFVEDYQINILTEKFKAYELVDSFGVDQVKQMIDYYFYVQQNPSWAHFVKNSSKVRKAMFDQIRDMETRKELAKQSREWLAK